MARRDKSQILGDLLDNTGLSGFPFIKEEWEYLTEKLTWEELGAVFRLLDRALSIVGKTEHLPTLQGWSAIKGEIERGCQ